MPRSDAELTNAATHVQYELGALVGCYERLLAAENGAKDLFDANYYLEAMLVHARCLIEFIAKRRGKRDIHRHDYLPGWEPSGREGDDARLLFKKISKHLSHLSWKRAEIVEPQEPPTWSYELPFFVVTLFEEFLVDIESANGGKPWFALFQEGIPSARRRLSAT